MNRFLIVLALVLIPLAITGQEVADVYTNHTVAAGDTLRSITRRYLGTDVLWRENWRLNPHVQDPDRLRVGDQLKIIQSRTIEAQRATIFRAVRDVSKAVRARGWVPARTGDQLQSEDGIRTLADSSAVLEFNEDSTIQLGEYSQLFLRSRETTLQGVDRGTIEVVRGGANVKLAPFKVDRPRTELVVITGSARTAPRGDEKGVDMHASTSEVDGRAALSMFEGSGEIEAGGKSVSMPRGTGVAVPDGGTPSDPVPLLTPPVQVAPIAGTQLNYNNPMMRWEPLAGAENYLVDICDDAKCEQVTHSVTLESPTKWQPGPLTMGDHYWRVAGLNDQGILGYSTKPSHFRVNRDWEDVRAPGVVAEIVNGPTEVDGNVVTTSPTAMLVFRTMDDGAGDVSVHYRTPTKTAWARWDGEPIALADFEPLLEFYAIDGLEQQTPTHSIAID